jgi:hypothetical protein
VLLFFVALVVLPLLAIPLYFVAVDIETALEETDTVSWFRFVFPVGLPGALAAFLALTWGNRKPLPALALAVATCVVSAVAIIIALLIWCSAVNCIT